jgi:hypothetical protein
MAMRNTLIVLGGAALVAGTAACTTPNAGGPAAPSTVTVTAAPAPTASSSPHATTAPATAATTTITVPPSASPASNQPCELLTLSIAEKFAGDDAQRRLSYDDTDPPVAVGDNGCYYSGSTGSVEFRVGPVPDDPTAPVNHFHVIAPGNRDTDLPYEAYWFGPGVSLIVVKNGLMLTFKVTPRPDTGNLTPETRAADIELANQIVPEVS